MSEVGTADWQHRLDREFPQGAVASWDSGDKHSAVYLAPRIYVTEVAEDDLPVIWVPVFAGSDKVLGPWRVTSYETVSLRPRKVRARFDGHAQVMLLSAGVNDRLAAAMSSERDKGIRQYPDGGAEVIHE